MLCVYFACPHSIFFVLSYHTTRLQLGLHINMKQKWWNIYCHQLPQWNTKTTVMLYRRYTTIHEKGHTLRVISLSGVIYQTHSVVAWQTNKADGDTYDLRGSLLQSRKTMSDQEGHQQKWKSWELTKSQVLFLTDSCKMGPWKCKVTWSTY